MRFQLSTLLIFFSFSSFAQKFEITGTALDSVSKKPLESATVYLESEQDSTLIAYSITGTEGKYSVSGNTAFAKAYLIIHYQGYKDYRKLLEISKSEQLKMPDVFLAPASQQLEDVIITAKKAPITVKQDTLEFNAQSFDTQPDATLEDVMKQLPGVEVSKDGKVTVNGREVSRILVNGKEFFGNDPKIALKNLPKEIIDKIQVTDSKTDEQKAAGEEGDPSVSEINITIDEDKNRGFFSRLTAGAGTEERYSLNGIANYFNNDFKVSILGSGNNINSAGFSFDEVFDAMGGSAFSISSFDGGGFGINGISFGGNGNGITTSQNGGINLSNDWGETVEASADYFYGNNDTRTATDTRRTTFLPDRSFSSVESNAGNTRGTSHRASSRVKIKPDTLTTINVRLNANIRDNRNERNSSSTSRNEASELINSIVTRNDGVSDNQDYGASLSYTRRLKEKGSYWAISTDLDRDTGSSNSLFFSQTDFADGRTEIQDQNIDEESDNTSFSINPRARQKLGEYWSISASYRVRGNVRNNQRSVFDRNGSASPIFNEQLSTDFTTENVSQRPRVGFRYKKDKWTVEMSGGILHQTLNNEDDLRGISFDQDFTDPYLEASVRRKIGKFGRFYVRYSNSINVPGTRQLQPFEDRTNPQNIITGNPNLDASQNHNFRFNLSNYNWEKGAGFYSGGSFSLRDRAVAAFSLIDEDLIRRTSYVNINGQYNASAYGTYRKKFKRDAREITVGLNMRAAYRLNRAFNNGVQFDTRGLTLTPRLELRYSLDEIIDVEAEYVLSNNQTTFENIDTEEQDFTNHTVSLDLTTFWPKNVVFGIRGEYQKFGNVTDEFDDDSIVLIGSLGYKFSKDRGSLKLKAYDLLNEIINTRRRVTDDFVADTSSLVLTQYFMLSLTYKFKQFGGKDPNSGNSIIRF